MFYCVLHNWSSHESPCPACHVTITTTATTENKKEWEVDCFTDGKLNFWRQPDGLYRNQIFEPGVAEEYFIRNPSRYTIRSVKRLSDDEVFYVREKIEANAGSPFTIKSFDVVDEPHFPSRMRVLSVEYGGWDLSKIRKIKPKSKERVYTKDELVGLMRDAVSTTAGCTYDETQRKFDKFLKERNLYIEEPRKPKTERIEAWIRWTSGTTNLNDGKGDRYCHNLYTTGDFIPQEKAKLIESAIEKALNDDTEPDFKVIWRDDELFAFRYKGKEYEFNLSHKYTQQQLDEAISNAFCAGRK